jgi:ribosomal 50S subunit-recycling heat shock protein
LRLDKFLKVSRLVKRRVVAKELCDAGRAMVNGRPAKAGHELAAGDVLELRFGQRTIKARVVELREHVPAAEADKLYELVPATDQSD